MQITRITEKDTEQFEDEWEQSDIEKGIRYSKEEIFYASEENKILTGYTKIQITDGVAHLEELMVKKEYRNQGIARYLIENFEKIAKQNNCHKLTLKTSENHKTALKLYKKMGYSIEATLKNHMHNITWYQMCKFIDK